MKNPIQRRQLGGAFVVCALLALLGGCPADSLDPQLQQIGIGPGGGTITSSDRP